MIVAKDLIIKKKKGEMEWKDIVTVFVLNF